MKITIPLALAVLCLVASVATAKTPVKLTKRSATRYHAGSNIALPGRSVAPPDPFPSYEQGGPKLVGSNAVKAGIGQSICVSADGKTALVGGPTDNFGKGAVWVYVLSGNTWVQQGLKFQRTGVVNFGWSVALSADGNTAIIGAPDINNTGTNGSLWVYKRTGTTWAKNALVQSGPGAVGQSVGVSAAGDEIITTNPNVEVDFFHYQTPYYWTYGHVNILGGWVQTVVGTAPGAPPLPLPMYSAAISGDGKTVVIGGDGLTNAYGVRYTGGRYGGPVSASLVGIGELAFSVTGAATSQVTTIALSADGATAIIGVPGDNNGQGAAWIFRQRPQNGGVWEYSHGEKLTGTSNIGAARQGTSVALSADGNTAIVGGAGDNANQGASWIYTHTKQDSVIITVKNYLTYVDTSWKQHGPKIVNTGNIAAAMQGTAVALTSDGQTAFVGGAADAHGQGAIWFDAILNYPPATLAQGISFSNVTDTSATAMWTNGNGDARAVFIAYNPTVSPVPADRISYTADTAFKAGQQLGTTGWYCIYNGPGSQVNIGALTAGTTYKLAVVEYNSTPGNELYTTAKLNYGNLTTLTLFPTIAAQQLKFSNTTANTTTVSWISGNGTHRAVFMRAGIYNSAAPVDSNTYAADPKFGSGGRIGVSDWYCIYNGTGSTVNISGLNAYSPYRVTVVEYYGAPGSERYTDTKLNPANVYTNGAPSLNSFYLPGGESTASTFSLSSAKVEVNNLLSPNGDGINDIWVVKNIAFYPDNSVTVYDKAGKIVFTKKGYTNDWDGSYRGSVLNSGTYYYLVDLGNGTNIKGYITVVKGE